MHGDMRCYKVLSIQTLIGSKSTLYLEKCFPISTRSCRNASITYNLNTN